MKLLSPFFSFQTRQKHLQNITKQKWDLIIVGGGVTGAACARDASLRGIKVLLLEASDFASGTSSGSSKLLHGGLRYLENKEFSLVYSAIRERQKLEQLYSPLVKRLEFVFPTYEDRAPSRRLLNLGLYVYDSFSYFREKHRCYKGSRAKETFPLLRPEKMTGALVYTDAFAEDYRLVIELIKSATRHGAVCLNRCAVTHLENANSDHFILGVQDVEGEREFKLSAQYVLNCAGPFSDRIRSMLNLGPRLHLTQGVHFVVPHKRLPVTQAYVLSDPPHDRILFAIPWNSVTYMGTTDTDIQNPSLAQATSEDLNYILKIMNSYFQSSLKKEDIIQSWAAVRPLLQPPEDSNNSEISREHRLEESPENFFHLLGGKLTSHRNMAEEAIDHLCKKMRISKKCMTANVPLQDKMWSQREIGHLESCFGAFSEDIREYDRSRSLQCQKLSSHLPHLVSELLYCLYHEAVLGPMDFLRRRSSIYYENSSIELLEAVGQIMRKELDWNAIKFNGEMEKCTQVYQRDRESFYS